MRLDQVLKQRAAEAKRLTNLERKKGVGDRILEEQSAALTQSGKVAFRFDYHNHHDPFGYGNDASADINFGCFIGGAGQIYTYKNDRYTEQPSRVPEADYNRAIKLAKSLHHQALKTRTVGINTSTGEWVVMVAGEVTFLKETGNSVGELSDPSAVELVKMIAAWCPSAAANLKLEQVGTQGDH